MVVELFDYARLLRRRWALILLAVVACGAGAFGVSAREAAVYKASVRVIVTGANTANADELTVRQLLIDRASVYAQLATTGQAIDAALQEAGVTRPRGLKVSATADGNSPFVSLSAESQDAKASQALVESYPTVLPGVLESYGQIPDATDQQLKIVNQSAAQQIGPKTVRNTGIGLAIGLILGLGIALLREALDRSFVDPDRLESVTGRTVLGVVPFELVKEPLPSSTHPGSGRAEAYRQVRTNLQFAGPEGALRSIVVTSARAGEGKTTLAANLAVALGRTGQRTLIVDADLRRPKVGETLGVGNTGPGLIGVLEGRSTLASAVQTADEGRLDVLTAGPMPGNPSEVLGSGRMESLIREMEDAYDVVVIDSPPVLPVTDPLVLAVMATSLLVVFRLGSTTREQLRRTLSSIDKVQAPLVGLVANGAVAGGDAAYGFRYGYGYYPTKGGKAEDLPADARLRAPDTGPPPSID